MATRAMEHPRVVAPAEWAAARKELLKKEKEFSRLRDELSRQRRELPWEKVEKAYVFDGPEGKETLGDLFGGKSQLLIYHFMFGPEWKEGCPSCSFVCDHIDGAVPHLAARDVTLTMVSRAPLAKIETFKKRMGWHFPWVSSFRSEEGPGASVFFKDPGSGEIFHTYSTYGRGLDPFVGTYTLLDLVPRGR